MIASNSVVGENFPPETCLVSVAKCWPIQVSPTDSFQELKQLEHFLHLGLALFSVQIYVTRLYWLMNIDRIYCLFLFYWFLLLVF